MLALTRKLDQAVYIGEDLVLTVTKLTPSTVQLELEQPDPVFPHRVYWQTVERRKGEAFQLASDVSVLVADIRPASVRLGFAVPGDIAVVREELFPMTEFPRTTAD